MTSFKPVFDLLYSFVLAFGLGNIITAFSVEPSYVRIVCYSLIFLFLGYLVSRHAFNKSLAEQDVIADITTRDSKLDVNPTYSFYFGFVSFFGVISHEFYLFDNSIFNIDDTYYYVDFYDSQWSIYAIDNMIRASFLDFFETYNLHISNINSTNNWFLTFVFLFKSTLSIIFLKALYNLTTSAWKMENP